jgi:hypothetical protein
MSEPGREQARTDSERALDDRGTSQQEGRAFLRRLRDNGFDADNAKLAVALGRPVDEIEAWLNGTAPLDDDLMMKARGIAQERGIKVA